MAHQSERQLGCSLKRFANLGCPVWRKHYTTQVAMALDALCVSATRCIRRRHLETILYTVPTTQYPTRAKDNLVVY